MHAGDVAILRNHVYHKGILENKIMLVESQLPQLLAATAGPAGHMPYQLRGFCPTKLPHHCTDGGVLHLEFRDAESLIVVLSFANKQHII